MAKDKNAVHIRDAWKSYGKGKKKTAVLKDLSMTVPKGCIYGLLGASGCGKTTLLSTIVGRRAFDSGELTVLGDKGNRLPLHRIGYMPQDIALLDELTIEETARYFSWIYGMPDEEFHEKLQFYMKLLDLPNEKRIVSKLSGGQKRRVSLMVTFFHDPELLILDEPTVGVDPVLREKIWAHLVEETTKFGKTVIITTHYIDEAKDANIIGLMRGGRLMAESSPGCLLSTHRTDSLEEVFLKLSLRQERNEPNSETTETRTPVQEINNYDCDESKAICRGERRFSNGAVKTREVLHISKGDDWEKKRKARARTGKWKALLLKNGIRFIRNPGYVAFNLFFPLLQVCAFFVAIGDDPKHLPFAVINRDVKGSDILGNCSDYVQSGCDDPTIGCRYIGLLTKSNYFQVMHMNELEEALEAVKRGKAWGALLIPENFTESIRSRREEGKDADEYLLDTGILDVYLDMSNDQIGSTLQRKLISEFRTLSGDVMQDCNINRKMGELPLRFEEPIFGDKNSTFKEFFGPPSIIMTIFFLAVVMTSTVMVTERYEGLWDRTLVSGITAFQLLLGHVILQVVLVLLQSVEALFIAFVVFGFPCRGGLLLSFLLTSLNGIAGMCCGFFVSVASTSISDAHYFATGWFYPVVLMGGSLWPLQGVPWLFRQLCYLMPTTYSNTAFRHILIRGWGLTKSTVQMGFISSLIWIAVFIALCNVILRIRK